MDCWTDYPSTITSRLRGLLLFFRELAEQQRIQAELFEQQRIQAAGA
jgi:hypothetical protein